MKSYSLIVALCILLAVSVSLANSIPVPEETEETVESDGAIEITVEPAPVKYYSPWLAGFANIIPSLGYFLIDEPVWGIAELCVVAGVSTFGFVFTATEDDSNSDSWKHVILYVILGGVLHAPLLAEYKNEQQKVALDFSPGVGLDSEGEVYPTVQLTLSF